MRVLQTYSFWLALLLCGLNLFIMHYNVIIGSNDNYRLTCYIDNLIAVVFDISIIFLIVYYLTLKHTNIAILLSFVITFFISFTNVVYSRFFHHYISLSAISHGVNLLNCQMLESILDSLKWIDIYYILCPILFCRVYRYGTKHYLKKTIKHILYLIILIWGCGVYYYLNYSFVFPLFDTQAFTFRRGNAMSLFFEINENIKGQLELSDAQIELIKKEKDIHKKTDELTLDYLKNQNVILILVESYMSLVSDMKVNKMEITPFLNTLKRDPVVYYNGHMKENVTIGESADGQFIYMTGLLPLRSSITVSKARNIVLPKIAKMLERESRMIIPTKPTMWIQDEMCEQYGFDYLFTSKDIVGNSNDYLNDEQVFQLAMQKDKESHQPFFSTILTMSMHQPYTRQNDSTFLINDKTIPHDLACYLNACHYTDRQIKKYFEHLKQIGIYDNSIIVIASDHAVHNTDFGGVNKDIPLYIVNIPHEAKDRMWKGECNQLDVFTTLLDLLGVESNWYGLGYSLLSPNYQNTIDSKKWNISQWIIRGDYFSTIEH